MPLRRLRALPAAVRGPVDFLALRRLASRCLVLVAMVVLPRRWDVVPGGSWRMILRESRCQIGNQWPKDGTLRAGWDAGDVSARAVASALPGDRPHFSANPARSHALLLSQAGFSSPGVMKSAPSL